MLAFREASPVVWRRRQWLNTICCGESRARNACYGYKVRRLGPVDHGGGQTAKVFSAWDSHQNGIWHLHGLQKHLSHNILWIWKIAWSPDLNENSETGLLFLGPFTLPCSPLFPCLWRSLLNYFFIKFYNKPDAPGNKKGRKVMDGMQTEWPFSV